MHVSGVQLSLAYSDNEVAADLKYKGVPLIVSDLVDSVSDSDGGGPVVDLIGDDDYDGPQAAVLAPNIAAVASLREGEPIKLICIGNGVFMGSPQLGDCLVLQCPKCSYRPLLGDAARSRKYMDCLRAAWLLGQVTKDRDAGLSPERTEQRLEGLEAPPPRPDVRTAINVVYGKDRRRSAQRAFDDTMNRCVAPLTK